MEREEKIFDRIAKELKDQLPGWQIIESENTLKLISPNDEEIELRRNVVGTPTQISNENDKNR